ncbi:MAG TPA: ABC transporter substrate-binding protein, partial [Spirochaetota bacterium]|nr:ABC transporter substrate-binding protein [Spirochaetota bacterium]
KYKIGKYGGTFTLTITGDPKTFNKVNGLDPDSRATITNLSDYLADYDPYTKEWLPNTATFKVVVDKKNDKLEVIYTLRDDLYWTTSDGKTKEKVTSNDVIFWYNEVDGDRNLQQPGFAQQFVTLKNGSSAHIDIEKIDELSFKFKFPRIINDPVLSTNMDFGPAFIYEKAKKEDGLDGLLKVHTIDKNVKEIPSIGPFHIVSYTPGVEIVLKRNPNYWLKDKKGNHLPYVETLVYKIVADNNTEFLLFKQGKIDYYKVRQIDLEELVNKDKKDYIIYFGGTAQDSGFICFNQNPANIDKKYYKWFKETKFRQAMSSLLNRDRIIKQIYRGLGEPANYLFARSNPYFDEDIKQKYQYNPKKALELLSEIGFTKKDDGLMYDKDGNKVEFEINPAAESNTGIDIANIFADELKNVGINLKVRPMDFQKIIEMSDKTYDFHSIMMRFGPIMFPSQGSNVWPSKGNYHLWYPMQSKPATDWEARVDYLYNEGMFTIDKKEAKKIYDEYQKIILEQNPLIYFVYPYSFVALRSKWQNVFY